MKKLTVILLLGFSVVAQGALVNRYSFTTADVAAVDSVSGRNGTLRGTASISGNRLVLPGGGAVDLPSDVLDPGLQSVTIEAWFQLGATQGWQRLFDFGETVGGNGGNTLFYTPTSGAGDSRFVIATNGAPSYSTGEQMVTGATIPVNTVTHIACVYDGVARQLRYYRNGVLVSSAATTMPLSGVSRVYAYIGDAVYTADPYLNGSVDEFRIYDTALTNTEVLASFNAGPDAVFAKGSAGNPSPADKATDVPRDTNLGWLPGQYAAKHDVYLGTIYADVSSATKTNHPNVQVSLNQDPNIYDPPAYLEYGKTYYWRIDEVNAPPTSTVYQGNIWSFTTEPFAYPIRTVTATASSSHNVNMGPGKTVDGSGLSAADLHSTTDTAMWLSSGTGSQPTWIQFEFDKAYKLQEMWVWNYNQSVEIFVGFGAKNVTVQYSTDGTNWTQLSGVPDFTQGQGLPDYAHDTTVGFGGVMAKYVKLTINSNWGVLKQYGLSEVRFLQVPAQAREPNPANAQTDVALDATLRFRAGREAATHKLYLSTSKKAVREGTVTPISIPAGGSSASYGPLSLELGKTYYWKVDEVNEAKTPATWPGEIWKFTTRSALIVDDFETYDDLGNRIFQTWIDGFGYSEPAPGKPGNGTGSTVGNLGVPFAETRVGYFHAGRQAMPMGYDNTKAPFYSEAERTFTTPQDWTQLGVKALTVWFRGLIGPGGFTEGPVGTFTIRGAGADIWDVTRTGQTAFHDEFHFLYKRLNGDGSIQLRVDSIENTNAWAKCGVMIRDTLDEGSAHAMLIVSPTSGIAFQYRASVGGNMIGVTQTGIVVPRWVRINRAGSTITAEHSADGVTWVAVGTGASITIPMNANVYIGVPLTSHSVGVFCRAIVSNIQTSANVTGQWQSQDIGISANAADPVYVAVTDSAGKSKVVMYSDPTAVQQTTWQEWNIPLKTFSDAGVNLQTVKKIALGAGNKVSPVAGGTGSLYADDIMLYPPRCLPALAKPAADLTSDCAVDYEDIDALADNWLANSSTITLGASGSANLVGRWRLDETSGATAADSSGNNRNGTVSGTPAWLAAGKIGGALKFDGVDDYVQLPIGPVISTLTDSTFALWVSFPNVGATWQRIFDFGTSMTVNMFLTPRNGTNNRMRFAITTGGGAATAESRLEAPTMLPAGWHHVAVVINGTSRTMQLYLDGSVVVSGTTNTLPSNLGNTTQNWLGRSQYPDPYFNGSLDDFRIYSRALSSAEVAWLAEQTPVIDMNTDGVINFKDYAAVATKWLEEILWP